MGGLPSDLQTPIMHYMGFKILYSGFEMRFGSDSRPQRCWDPIAKHIPNLGFGHIAC